MTRVQEPWRAPERQKHETGRAYALRALREGIVSLALAPGSMLSENDLAARLGLSRTPVREALIALSRMHLVEIYPQKGSAVTRIDYSLVEEACFVRSVLEQEVAELACKTAQKQDCVELNDSLLMQERCLASGRTETLLELDNELHRRLFVMARRERTWEMLTGFTLPFDRVRRMSLGTEQNARNVADHRAIVEAVAAGDAPAARAHMREHLSRYRVDAGELRRRFPEEWFMPD